MSSVGRDKREGVGEVDDRMRMFISSKYNLMLDIDEVMRQVLL